jgi:hypothetical protein
MNDAPNYDPIRKSIRESPNIWAVWLRNGESMTWIQRIGFAVVSLGYFSFGLFIATLAIGSFRDGDLLSLGSVGAVVGVVAGVCLLIVGILGLRNVLRF